MTAEKWQEEKKQERLRDRERIATGEATPEQVQRENEIFNLDGVEWSIDWEDHSRRLDACLTAEGISVD